MTPHELLTKARARLADPAHWTKGAFAKHANGRTIGPTEANAACWCIQGAMAAERPGFGLFGQAETLLRKQLPRSFQYATTDEFNDHPDTKHEDVLALLDRAIAAQLA